MQAGQLTDPKAALDFMLGGNATFTLKSKVTQNRYTFKVRVFKHDPTKFFVSYLVGSDNENDYAYIGIIQNDFYCRPYFKLTKKSKLLLDSQPIKAITWAVQLLSKPNPEFPAMLEVWHEGRCCRCGRTLTVPESVASGVGPECAKRKAA